MFTIEIVEKKTDRTVRVALPTSKFAVNDCMDRAHISGETMLVIYECNNLPELENAKFTEPPTLEELNYLAKRIVEISKDPALVCAYRALLKTPFDTVGEVINRTFGLKTIPVIACSNAEEYGKIVLENGILEELGEIPDEIMPLIDLKKIGELAIAHDGGVFVDGYYAATNCYEPVLVYDDELPEPMEDWVFKMKVASIPAREEDFNRMKTDILTLPADEDHIQDIAEALGEKNIKYCTLMKFYSAIPQLHDDGSESIEDIYELNELARKFSELSREEAAKFKAVLELEKPRDLQSADYLLSVLSEFEFDNSVMYPSEYGEKYLAKFLPECFDRTLFDSLRFDIFGKRLIHEMGGDFNCYGFISKRGGQLYAMPENKITAPKQEPRLAQSREQGETTPREMSL